MTQLKDQDSPVTAPRRPTAIASVPVRLVLHPGQRGTKHLSAQYGDSLVSVRYRYDLEHQVRYKTVELVVEQKPWQPREVQAEDRPVEILAVGPQSRQTVCDAGAEFVPARGLWRLPLTRVRKLHLVHRIVDAEHEFTTPRRSAE